MSNQARRRTEILKWLALFPLIPAGPLLLFGLTWGVFGLLAAGLAFVALSVVIWRAFAGEWPMTTGR